MTAVSDSRLSNLSATRVLHGFEEYMARFASFNPYSDEARLFGVENARGS